jgi:hypothetical protein
MALSFLAGWLVAGVAYPAESGIDADLADAFALVRFGFHRQVPFAC